MESSLRQLDDYLKRIGRTEVNLEEQDVSVVQEESKGIVDISLQGKSSESFTITEKSSHTEGSEDMPLKSLEEKSNTFIWDSTPSKHNSIDSDTGLYDSSDTVTDNCQTQEQSCEDNNFGSEATVFSVSDSTNKASFIESVKPESVHFEESEEAANELAEIGLSEESLQEFALSGTQATVVQEVNSKTVTSTVHPVFLKKSKSHSEKAVTTKPPKGQVTTLLDLSSIDELKRLWAKSNKPVKKQADGLGFSMRSKSTEKSRHTTSDETGMIPGTPSYHKTVLQVSEGFSASGQHERDNLRVKRTNILASHTRQCKVKLVRVEGLVFPENLKIDLSFPNTSFVLDSDSNFKNVSGRSKPRFVGKKNDKNKGNVKTLVANSLNRLNAKSATNKACHNTKNKKQTAQKEIARNLQKNNAIDKTAKHLKTEAEETEGYYQGDQDVKRTNGELYINNEESYAERDDDDNEYVPSDDYDDDDYNPKKKTRKVKVKRTHSVKSEIMEDELDNWNSMIRSSGKKRKGTRIGRPPVFGHFECKICEFTANEKNLVDKHYYKFHRMVLTCEHCDKKFRSVNGLLEHKAYKHDGGKPFKCEHDGCTYASKNPTDLDRHQAKHETELKHVCDICGWRTKWRRNMRHHHTLKHCDERKYKCTVCEFAAKRPYDLKEHMYRHTDEKPIQCLICGFRVKTNYELRSHMLVHSNEKPFKCTFPGCSSATKTKADLTKHMRVHQTERPFKCHICSRTYKDQHALNKHITGIHVAEKKFKCDICGKSFKNRYALKKHMNVHAGHKPYQCPVCQWKFSTKSNMESHMVTHDTSVRPYPCPLCPHAAKQPDHLLAHIGTVHGDKYAYFCELCKKPFKRYMQLKVHYERMHTRKEVEKLKNSGDIDLALLKMEIKLELEEKEAGKKRKRKSRSKSKTLVSDVDIKEEPIDDEYGDTEEIGENQISDVRLDENTGRIEIIRKKSVVGNNVDKRSNESVEMVAGSDLAKDEIIDSNESGHITAVAVELMQTSDSNTKDKPKIDQVSEIDRSEGHIENEVTVGVPDGENDVQVIGHENETSFVSEEQQCKESEIKESVLIAKGNVSTVALYENLRLPLATRGFKFNYNKNGTKPMKAWFMDVSLMDRETAEKHKKHRRRLGLLPPIPRGHPPKGYKRLKNFVDKRKKQLAENIKKAKFAKDLGLVSKRNAARSKRFQGKYTEFETLGGESLSITEVQERLPKVEYPIKEKLVPIKQTSRNVSTTRKIGKASKPSKPTANISRSKVKSGRSAKQSTNTKAAVKKETAKILKTKKKGISKKASTNRSKLLLSTEKKKPGKSKPANLKIRKPAFLEKRSEVFSEAMRDDRNSFDALQSILSEINPISSAASESEKSKEGKTEGKQKAKNKAKSQTRISVKNQKSKKSNKKEESKPKYNKKYVPVKNLVKRKNDCIENNSAPKKMKTTCVTIELQESKGKTCFVSEPTSSEQITEADPVHPSNLHTPFQNSQLVMVYPTSVIQGDNLLLTREVSGENVMVSMNANNPYMEEASPKERLEFKRNLNDMLTDSSSVSGVNNTQHNASVESDKELMQKEYTCIETYVVKAEPCEEEMYNTSHAVGSTGI